MKVKDLIRELSKYPDEWDVCYWISELGESVPLHDIGEIHHIKEDGTRVEKEVGIS